MEKKKKQRKKLTPAEKKRAASKKATGKKRQAAAGMKKETEAALEVILDAHDEKAIDGPEHIAKTEAGMLADQGEIPEAEKKLIEFAEEAKAAEPQTPVEIVPPPPDEESWAAVEHTEEFQRAFRKAMDMFAEFITYERDNPKEPRIFMFPAYMHIKELDCAREIVTLYSPVAPKVRELDPIALEDLKLIQEGISDSISILRVRTHDAFPMRGERALTQIEYEVLLALTMTETRLWYRIQPVDVLVGYIRISSQDLDMVSDPAGTRNRTWLTVRNFTRHFYMVLADDSVEDMVEGLIQESDRSNRGLAKYFRRWREAGKI